MPGRLGQTVEISALSQDAMRNENWRCSQSGSKVTLEHTTLFANGAETCHFEIIKLTDEPTVKTEPAERSAEEMKKMAEEQLKRYVAERPPHWFFNFVSPWGSSFLYSNAFIATIWESIIYGEHKFWIVCLIISPCIAVSIGIDIMFCFLLHRKFSQIARVYTENVGLSEIDLTRSCFSEVEKDAGVQVIAEWGQLSLENERKYMSDAIFDQAARELLLSRHFKVRVVQLVSVLIICLLLLYL